LDWPLWLPAIGLNSEPQPGASPSVVSSELKNSGSNELAGSNIESRISNVEAWINPFANFTIDDKKD
jgi:hypothetical protein